MTWLGLLIAAILIATAAAYVIDCAQPSMTPPDVPPRPVVAGYAVLICHRRAQGRSGRALAAEWGPARALLVASHRDAIGFGAYKQVHQVSRLNILYNLIRASRAWPVAALFSVLQGLPVPRPGSSTRRDAEDWDVIELLEFPDAATAHAFLSGAGASGARATLENDTERWMRRRQTVPMQLTRALADADQQDALTIYCLRARPHLGRASMIDYWLDRHRPFVLGLQPVLGFGLYDQLVARKTDRLEQAASELSYPACAPWDGVAVLGYPTMSGIWRGLANPRIQSANLKLVYDETCFIDAGRSSLMLGRVRHRL